MPELPEVESIKLQLQKYLVGHKITNIKVKWPKIFSGDKEKILGAPILDIRRFGKVLVVDFENSYSLVIQIKLTGQLLYQGPNLHSAKGLSQKILGGVGGKHTHVIFRLDRDGVLYYNDVRKFGRMFVIDIDKVKETGLLGKLGAEFLKDMTLAKFSEIVQKSGNPIKILLMDQQKMAGVGNIYANDALWLAGVDPRKKSSSLSASARKKLFEAIESVLKEGIKRGGASELAFVTPDGREGNYQDYTLVYGRENEPCKVCKTPIKKIKLGGRGTYFCPVCQR